MAIYRHRKCSPGWEPLLRRFNGGNFRSSRLSFGQMEHASAGMAGHTFQRPFSAHFPLTASISHRQCPLATAGAPPAEATRWPCVKIPTSQLWCADTEAPIPGITPRAVIGLADKRHTRFGCEAEGSQERSCAGSRKELRGARELQRCSIWRERLGNLRMPEECTVNGRVFQTFRLFTISYGMESI